MKRTISHPIILPPNSYKQKKTSRRVYRPIKSPGINQKEWEFYIHFSQQLAMHMIKKLSSLFEDELHKKLTTIIACNKSIWQLPIFDQHVKQYDLSHVDHGKMSFTAIAVFNEDSCLPVTFQDAIKDILRTNNKTIRWDVFNYPHFFQTPNSTRVDPQFHIDSPNNPLTEASNGSVHKKHISITLSDVQQSGTEFIRCIPMLDLNTLKTLISLDDEQCKKLNDCCIQSISDLLNDPSPENQRTINAVLCRVERNILSIGLVDTYYHRSPLRFSGTRYHYVCQLE